MKILSVDMSTHNNGWAYFQNGKLVSSGVKNFNGNVLDRIMAVENWLAKEINRKKIDVVLLEDIQFQNNVLTYKILAMLRPVS